MGFVKLQAGNQFIISKQNNSGMKNLRLFLVFFIIGAHTFGYSQIGIQTNNPDASSALDIVSTNKGLLVPRVSLTADLSSPNPVTSPATGLIVFNSGANQPQGFYYWGGAAWVKLESGTGTITGWELTGNSGTTAGTNFVGTTDSEDLVFKTNNVERMRILDDGSVGIMAGGSVPFDDNKFQVNANSTDVDAISAYSNDGYGVYARTYGLTSRQYAIYGRTESVAAIMGASENVNGSGVVGNGNNVGSFYPISGSGGAFFGKKYGAYAKGKDLTNGTGIGAAGNNQSIATLGVGSGGAFTGAKYGSYSKANNSSNGNGAAGVGNGGSTIYVPSGGSGGSFTGDSVGVYGKGVGTNGNGVIGRGNGGSTYHYPTAGSGGSFSGNIGVYGYTDITDGHGVVGVVGGSTYSTPADGTGTGGSFTGPIAVYGHSSLSTGTAIVGVGNDGGNYHTMPDGSGGAFSGFHGVYGYAEDTDEGHGVIGLGNNGSTRYSRGDGSGGSFTGLNTGVEGFATTTSTSTYGVYGKFQSTANVNGVGVYGYSFPRNNRGYGVVGEGGNLGVLSINAMATTGNMQSKIDHPLDPRNKILKHYAMESPEVLNMYRGNVHLDENGEATVSLPEYFAEININFSYNLTPIGQQAPNLFVKEEVDGKGNFVISGGNSNQKISWVVYAERNDLYMQRERENNPNLVEVEKEEENKGKYLMPELFNQPPEMGIFYSGKSVEEKADRQNKNQDRKAVKRKDVGEKDTVAKEEKVEENEEK